jgi:hypothetical protein
LAADVARCGTPTNSPYIPPHHDPDVMCIDLAGEQFHILLRIRPRMARSAASLASCAFPMAGSAGVAVDPRSSRSALQCTGLAAHARGGCRRPLPAHLCASRSEGGDTSSPAPASLTTPSALVVARSDTCARIYSEVAPPGRGSTTASAASPAPDSDPNGGVSTPVPGIAGGW